MSKYIKFKKDLFWACKKISLFYENKDKKINFLKCILIIFFNVYF